MNSAKSESARRCYRCKGSGKIRIDVLGNVNSVPAAQSFRLSAVRRALPWVKGRHEEGLP